MWIFMIIALLGPLLSTVSAVAVLPARQAASASQCTPSTVYSYITITRIPPTVTIADYNPAAVSSQAASDASIDTEYEIEQSQLRPVSESAPTTLPVHTHVLTAPAFPVTEASDGVYWFETRTTTRWGIIPTGDNWPVGTTLVTVYPLSASTSHPQAQQPSGTGTLTLTVSPLPASASGSVVSAATDVSSFFPPYALTNTSSPGESSVLTLSMAEYSSTVTVDVVVTETATAALSSGVQPAATGETPPRDSCGDVCVRVCYKDYGCWCNNWGGPGATSTATCYSTTVTPTAILPTVTARIVPRQTCTLISAPGFGSWCNNWDGSTVLTYTAWETTTTPGVTESDHPSTTTSTAVQVTATSTVVANTSSTTPSPTHCGESGPFEISFDDLPVPSIPANDTELHPPFELRGEFMHHFVWAIDWTYGPPPNEPYRPHDPPFLAWYIPGLNDGDINSPSHNTGSIPPGASFGAGPRNDNSSFWFNAESAYAACDNVNLDPKHTCDFVATAYQYKGQRDEVVATQHFTLAPCRSNITASCSLQSIQFSSEFTQLSALSFYANVQGQLRPLYLDSLVLNWWDNSCTAGLERQGSP